MFSDGHLTIPELDNMLVGEKLSEGADLYDEVWENIAPLSAGVYMIVDYLFGRSQNAFYWLSLFFVFFQCFLFNRLLLINKAYNENTYVPGLIYGLLMSFFFDFLTLTPVVMSQTFILLALNNIFSHIEFRAKRDEKILNIGIYLGVASLFYLPNIIFALAALVVFIFFTGTVLRRYLLLVFGFMLPLLLVATYFLLTDRFADFIYSFINPIIAFKNQHYIDLVPTLILFALPLLLLLASFVRINQRARFTNYQTSLTQVMFVWMIFCALFVLISNQHSPNIYIVFVPSVAFFLSHYLLLIRRRLVTEVIFTLFLAGVVLVNLGTSFNFFFTSKYITFNDYLTGNPSKALQDKKVLVLDDDLNPYLNAKPATPFIDWNMSKSLFSNLDYYDNQVIIYEGFKKDMPEVIIDPNDVMKNVFEKIPAIANKYRKSGNRYYLRS